MYPRTFRPSTTCTLNDGLSHSVTLCPTQLFKPLLGYSTNGPQSKILSVSLPNQAGIILRGLVQHPIASPLGIICGPQNWGSSHIPFVTLDEDPNGFPWYFMDALPWLDQTGTKRIWSFFAATSYVPPPPPPPTPVTLGATLLTSTPLTPGTRYTATIPAGTSGYGYIPQAPATTNTSTTTTGLSVTSSLSILSGSTVLAALTGGPYFANGTYVDSGGGVGPDGFFKFSNTGGGPATVVWTPSSP